MQIATYLADHLSVLHALGPCGPVIGALLVSIVLLAGDGTTTRQHR